MNNTRVLSLPRPWGFPLTLLFPLTILLLAVFFSTSAWSFSLTVVDPAGNPVGTGYRWLLEEDNTNQSPPGVRTAGSIGLDIHKSHAPAVAAGRSATATATVAVPDPAKRYFVSVLPDAGYALGGATVAAGASAVRVTVTPHAAYNPALPNAAGTPTAQISVLVFEDHFSINNAPDVPNERGLAGFTVVVKDAAGQVMQDAFGNPLGTTYREEAGLLEVDMPGNGLILTDENGEALIKYLPPGKYGLIVIPPTVDPASGQPVTWIQTATIEGTPTIDAWVKANEPPLFVEGFGTGFKHVSFGYVNPEALPWAGGGPGGATITGRNLYNHFSRPPFLQGFHAGDAVAECWVGLNDPVSGEGLLALPCGDDSAFAIPGVPAGTYQLVTWDKPLDALFGFHTITVPEGATDVSLGDVLSFRWFGTLQGKVFYDVDADGFPDAAETGLAEQNINIRFRDGTIYQSQATDVFGEYELGEVFPFFKWLVAEVDFARFQATGLTAVIDHGGEVLPDQGWNWPSAGKLTPQPQAEVNPNTGNNLSRTEKGPVLTQATHLFLGQTNVIDWGKKAYGPGENGGISGIVYYAVTRAENDPRYAAADPWEPGIPRVQVNLYGDIDLNGAIDDLDGDGGPTPADVDNWPFGWRDGAARGAEDIDRNGNGAFEPGDAIQIVTTDSWDDNPPGGCIQTLPVIDGVPAKECFDNFGTWNQVRPGLFDGGYAFTSHVPGGLVSGRAAVAGLPTGGYIVEAANPRPGVYLLVREEDRNVDFGEPWVPSPQLLPPACVGEERVVPGFLTFDGVTPAPFAGDRRPLCDRKEVRVADGLNTAVDFFYYTEVPKAARAVGFVNNDLAAEFDPTSPIFGEKGAPAWIPIAFRDWQGNELVRVYSDEYGAYNALLPSTYTVNLPTPSGVSPNMLTLVLNDPGPISDPVTGQMVIDPHYDERFGITPWTFHFETGKTTYLDTPIVPLAAFATMARDQLDIGPPAGQPVLGSVTRSAAEPVPLVCSNEGANTLTITAGGDGSRDHGFGDTPGEVRIGDSAEGIAIVSWTAGAIEITVDPALVAGGPLTVSRGDNGQATETGVTVQVEDCTAVRVVTGGSLYPQGKIQAAVDAAAPGDLILVGPGLYNESVIVYKPVRLQGAGETTFINANPAPTEKLAAWHARMASLGLGPFRANESPGFFVIGDAAEANTTDLAAPMAFDGTPALIDGFTISGSNAGGGIQVDTHVHNLTISNNLITNNQGSWGGGVVLGQPDAGTGAENSGIAVIGNRIVANSGIQGGGGVVVHAGNDGYRIAGNLIAGNFSRASGGGIAHVGLSDGGLIAGNRILFNEVFYGLLAVDGGHGGGIFVAGEAAAGQLGEGAGDVTIERNLIQGNLAGAGNGGGIFAFRVNGQEVADNPDAPDAWHLLAIRNNLLVNNVAALAGGGIALQDAARTEIVHNTLAYNDTTATAALAFPAGNLTVSTPQPAGIAAYGHSLQLRTTGLAQSFSDPLLVNNILWSNRAFFNDGTLNGGQGGLFPASMHRQSDPADPVAYPDAWDLGVVGTAAGVRLNPLSSLLSDAAGYLEDRESPGTPSGNLAADPGFVRSYRNLLQSSAILDEGGNFISVRFTPLTATAGDYHLVAVCSPAVDAGSDAGFTDDFDGNDRPAPGSGLADIGADEFYAGETLFPELTILRPLPGEVVPAGSVYTLLWGAPAEAASFDLGYSLGLGHPFGPLAQGVTDNCFRWSVPNNLRNQKNARLGVIARDAEGALLGRQLSEPFTIDVIALLSPNGGETLVPGNVSTITWTSRYAQGTVATVGLLYQGAPDLPWTPIGTAADIGRFDWTVPATPSATARIGLVLYDDRGHPLLADASDAPFTIVASAAPAAASTPAATAAAAAVAPAETAGRTSGFLAVTPLFAERLDLGPEAAETGAPASRPIEVVGPNGGELLTAGEVVPILWISPPSPEPVAKVEVALSLGGEAWQVVAELTADTEYLEWTVPAVPTPAEECRIEVRRFDADGKRIDVDRSDLTFAIVPAAGEAAAATVEEGSHE